MKIYVNWFIYLQIESRPRPRQKFYSTLNYTDIKLCNITYNSVCICRQQQYLMHTYYLIIKMCAMSSTGSIFVLWRLGCDLINPIE